MWANQVAMACTVLLGLHGAMAAVVDDFERADPGFASAPPAVHALIDAENPPATGKAFSLAWPDTHKILVEANYAKPVPMPTKPGELSALRFDLWLPAAPSIASINTRILDAKGQVFQWVTLLPPSPVAGWRTIVIPLDAAVAGHWAGPNDGKLVHPARLFGFTFNFANLAVPAGRLLIDNIRLEPHPTVTLETDRFPALVNPSDTGKCDLVITNPLDHEIAVSLKGTLLTYAGSPTEITTALTVPANGTARAALPLPNRQPGIRWLNATLGFDNIEFNYKTSFILAAPVPRNPPGEGFRFSICSHTEKCTDAEQELEIQAAAAAGANEMRINDSWAHIQPKPDVWRWDIQDRLVELAARYNIQTQMTLGYTPSWAISESLRAEQVQAYQQKKPDAWKISLFGPPEEEPWRNFVRTIVTRYRGKIRLYEIWNEPDLGFWRGTTEQYIERLRWASEEIRKADPDAKVMSGGFATVLAHAGRARNPDLQERTLAEASEAFDIHAIHLHGPFMEFKGAIDGELQRIRSRMTYPRPLYFNETAIASNWSGEKHQANTLVKKMSYVLAKQAIGYTWYDLRNDGNEPGNPEHNYGLLTADFRPKASFAAYGEFVRQMHGMQPLGELDLGPDRYAYAFGSPRGRVIAWWYEGPKNTGGPVILRSGAGPIRSADIMGVVTELPSFDGFVLAQPTSDPQYIVMPSGEGVGVEGQLVRLEGPKLNFANEPLKLTAIITNPWSHPITVDLGWLDAIGRPVTHPVTVASRSEARVPIVGKSPQPRQSTCSMELSYALPQTQTMGKMQFSSAVARVIDTAPPENRAADWVLDKRSDYLSFTEADPSLVALNWRGPEDLSARVWVWKQDNNTIRIRVDALDDAHVQKEKARDMFKGDSLQIAIQSVRDKQIDWELGVAQADDGSLMRAVWASPPGIANPESRFAATCSPIPSGLRYEVTLACDALGLTDANLRDGLRFNLLVNDNDGNLRKGLVRIAQGFGDVKYPQLFHVICLPTDAKSSPPVTH